MELYFSQGCLYVSIYAFYGFDGSECERCLGNAKIWRRKMSRKPQNREKKNKMNLSILTKLLREMQIIAIILDEIKRYDNIL